MNTSSRVGYWKLGLVSFVAMGYAIAFNRDCALAQITPDGTLGAESSVVTPTAPGSPVDVIDGGATRGANLFHSFDEFSVPNGGEAFFNNAEGIQNILTRVTGGSISTIEGLLRANGTANLFLLNPNGIIFGPNASLDIGGSFVGSTASSLNFADGTQFSATAPQTTPLLTVSVPIGLQYGGTAGGISSSGSVLRVSSGQSLLLLGGNVNLDGSFLYVDYSQGGRIELGGVSGPGTVGLNVDGNNLRLSFPNEVARADVSLSNRAQLDVSAEDGGSIAINARNLDVSGESTLTAGIAPYYGAVDSQAGDITLNATGAVTVTDSSTISNKVEAYAVGNAGGIDITAGSLSVRDGARLNASTSGQGNAGSVSVNVRDTVSFDGVGSYGLPSSALSNVEPEAVGNAGDVNITAGSLSVKNGALLESRTRAQGNAGSVNINVRDTVTFDGDDGEGYGWSSGAYSSVEEGAVGKGGNINITTGSLSALNGARLSAGTSGQGNAGSVNINVRDTVTFDGEGYTSSGAYSSVEEGAVGKGGNINITTGSLSALNGARLSAGTEGQGNAGSVSVNARDTVSFDGVGSYGLPSSALSNVEPEAVGNAGDVNITAGSLSVKNGALLESRTRAQGNAGSVNINVRDTVTFDGDDGEGYGWSSGAYSSVEEGAVGKGGNINITTGSLSALNGARLSAGTEGQGNAGSVTINARDTVSFDGVGSYGLPSSALSNVEPEAVGNAGDVNITAGSLSVKNGALLESRTRAQGNAGSVNINVRDTVTFDGDDGEGYGWSSGAYSSVEEGAVGKGGNINITTGSLSALNGARLSAGTSGQGNAGSVNINVRDTVTFDGEGYTSSGAYSSVENLAVGNGGGINITTGSLSLANGAQLTASTSGQGNGGTITINANTLSTVNGGQVLTTSRSSGQAGDITLNVTDSVTLAGSDRNYSARPAPPREYREAVVSGAGPDSGLFANTSENSTGQGGNLTIETGQLNVQDGAEVTVSSPKGLAGNLTVTADSIRLDEGKLTAVTGVSEGDEGGANITLQGLDLLLMRNESLISAQALGTANGGNVTLNSTFLTALSSEGLEGSDIIANAEQGNGGRINITTQGTFGIEERKANPGNRTNDIDASSQFGRSGSVELNTPDVDPSQGLVELPAELVDASNSFAQGCPEAVWRGESKFIITGRGGLPPSPHEPLRGDNTLTNWSTLDSDVENRSSTAPATNPTKETVPTTIVEANGWVKSDNGEVTLVANAPTATLDIPWLPSTDCNAPEPSS